jgi:hypothetical protein
MLLLALKDKLWYKYFDFENWIRNWNQTRNRNQNMNRNPNFTKVGTGTAINHYGSTALHKSLGPYAEIGSSASKLSFPQGHRLNMELDLQSLFGLHVHSCTHWLRVRPRNSPIPPAYVPIYEGAIGAIFPFSQVSKNLGGAMVMVTFRPYMSSLNCQYQTKYGNKQSLLWQTCVLVNVSVAVLINTYVMRLTTSQYR